MLKIGWKYAGWIVVLLVSSTMAGSTSQPTTAPVDSRFQIESTLVSEDLDRDLSRWAVELEKGGTVSVRDASLEIDVPGGCTVWLKQRLDGPVMIEYEATLIKAGGANDRVSDLNCFWMARDSRSPDDLFATTRSGAFADYNHLECYYVGQGGNDNTTTRFRRYIGDARLRPLLPEHDLRDKRNLLEPNVPQTIRLIASDKLIQYYRNHDKVFDVNDAEPYTSGWFGFRTTENHMTIRRFRVYRLIAR